MNEVLIEKVKEEILQIGYNPIHLGTKYLIETIYIIYEGHKEKTISNINIEKEIYIQVAKKYNKKVNTIKSNIIKATNFVDLKKYYNTPKLTILKDMKLTPKLVIWQVIDKLNTENNI